MIEPSDDWAPADWCRYTKQSHEAGREVDEECLTHSCPVPVGQGCPNKPESMKKFHDWFYYQLNKLGPQLTA